VICAGLDVGSRTIKLVTLDGNDLKSQVAATGANPLKRCRELIGDNGYRRLVVTGYGRHLVAPALGGEAISEIKAFALGSHHLFPGCRAVIDIGGQDCKVIRLSADGTVQKFEMNDRCAAGTGRFLEVTAATLEVPVGSLGNLALGATRQITLNSLCTVFAESEVVSLIGRGEETAAIALALHEAIAVRIAAMSKRVNIAGKTVFAGGAALNRCLGRLIAEKLAIEMVIPDSPQTVGALGAALLAREGD